MNSWYDRKEVSNMATFVNDHKHLFKEANKKTAEIALSIAEKVISTTDYNISPKQTYILKTAYDYIKPIVKEKEEHKKKFDALSPMDKLWKTHSSTSWVDDEGPETTMSYSGFVIVYNEMNNKIKELEKEVNDLKYFDR